jgi:hypothetical protein
VHTFVAIAKLAGRRCRWLDRDRDFHRAVSCASPRFLRRARGGWRFAIRAHLPRGRYLLFVRSVDSYGNVEVARTRTNTVRFRVR